MKKNLFGYSIPETDRVISEIQEQLKKMTDEKRSLEMSLDMLKAQCQNKDSEISGLSEKINKLQSDVAEANSISEEFKAENNALKNYVNDINEKKLKLDAEHDNIIYISKKVYGELIEMRQSIIEDTNESIDHFSEHTQNTNVSLKEVIQRIYDIKEETSRELENSFSKFREELDLIANSGKDIENALIDVEMLSQQLRERVNTSYYKREDINNEIPRGKSNEIKISDLLRKKGRADII